MPFKFDGIEPVSKSDGNYVQIIHSNGGEFGMLNSTGSADFYPNGGSHNPGCLVEATGTLFEHHQKFCNHARAWHFYQATVCKPTAFPAITCKSWDDFLRNDDENCYKKIINYMGFGADPRYEIWKKC